MNNNAKLVTGKDDTRTNTGSRTSCISGVSVVNGMLSFADFDHFWDVYICL